MPHLETGTDVFFFCWCLWDPCEIPLHCFFFFWEGGISWKEILSQVNRNVFGMLERRKKNARCLMFYIYKHKGLPRIVIDG